MNVNDAVNKYMDDMDKIVNDNPGSIQATVQHGLLQRTQRMRETLANPVADEPEAEVQEPAESGGKKKGGKSTK